MNDRHEPTIRVQKVKPNRLNRKLFLFGGLALLLIL